MYLINAFKSLSQRGRPKPRKKNSHGGVKRKGGSRYYFFLYPYLIYLIYWISSHSSILMMFIFCFDLLFTLKLIYFVDIVVNNKLVNITCWFKCIKNCLQVHCGPMLLKGPTRNKLNLQVHSTFTCMNHISLVPL